jgi:hypothetical protein
MKRLHIRPEAELDVLEAAVWYENEKANLGFEFEGELSSIYQRIDGDTKSSTKNEGLDATNLPPAASSERTEP